MTISDLRDLGVIHWHIPPVGDYPAKAVPWEPKDGIQDLGDFFHAALPCFKKVAVRILCLNSQFFIQDKQLAAIRESRGYNYADIITCSEEWGSVGRKRLTMITSHGFHLNFMFFWCQSTPNRSASRTTTTS